MPLLEQTSKVSGEFTLSFDIEKSGQWAGKGGLIKAKHEKCVSRRPPNNIYPTCKFVRDLFNCLPNVFQGPEPS